METERIEALEVKVAFQEKTIRELNDVLFEQQKQLDRLSALCADLVQALPGASDGQANEKPPHY